jgi:hypothetical protein
MKIVTLTSDEDLETYRHLTQKYINVLFQLEYLKRSKVVAFRLRNGEICGGYVLVKNGPFRVLDSIPSEHRHTISTDLSNVAEITGLWLDSQKADNVFCSAILWLALYFGLLFSSFDGFVYAYSLKKENLKKLYSTFHPISLFKGLTIQQEGMIAAEEEAVEFVSKLQAGLAPFRQYEFLTRRITIVLRSMFVKSRRKYRRLKTFS